MLQEHSGIDLSLCLRSLESKIMRRLIFLLQITCKREDHQLKDLLKFKNNNHSNQVKGQSTEVKKIKGQHQVQKKRKRQVLTEPRIHKNLHQT